MYQLAGRALPLHYPTYARKLLSLLFSKFLFDLLLSVGHLQGTGVQNQYK